MLELETNINNIAIKYEDKTPEDILDMMNTRTGIRQLRSDMKTLGSKGEILFDTLAKQKIRSILRRGCIESNLTEVEFYDVVNQEKNYELLCELLSDEVASKLHYLAKKLALRNRNWCTRLLAWFY